MNNSLSEVVGRFQSTAETAGVKKSVAYIEAVVLTAGIYANDPEGVKVWREFFKDADFSQCLAKFRQWRNAPSPQTQVLLGTDARQAQEYARAIVELSADTVNVLVNPELSTINSAGFVAGAHMQAISVVKQVAQTANHANSEAQTQTKTETATVAGSDASKPVASLEELLAKLDRLVGLERAKEEIKRQTALLKIQALRKASNLKSVDVSKHLVFVGNPGTGKTTVARLVADIYRALSILEKGQLVECDRADLVAGYVGQTAIKTDETIQKSLGGVLFIDEAYSLASDEFGDEAIATLVKGMEDHREDLVVIVAGYPDRMQEFIGVNPGLESRFHTTITFEDFTNEQLIEIFNRLCADSDFAPTKEASSALQEILDATPRDQGFGNGRFMRNLFEAAITAQATRLSEIPAPSIDQLKTLEKHDLFSAKEKQISQADW